MFHSGPCSHCHGTGYATKDGEALPLEDLIAMISARRNEWRQRYYQLLHTPGVREAAEAHAERQRAKAHDQAMGYGMGKYSGD
ncbi:hypothetical protein [Modicisalibacter luteus]|uniref:Uncharacterized protein n=1 Tax=Modicisalibacter luteus TaxID=453962 RepID=A0ABV7M354_9GAMM|nr:hypothetical protein [Halomonas lutea]GHA85176.1 hypothetical protein GCM10007159_02810 [Halomonas lutea]